MSHPAFEKLAFASAEVKEKLSAYAALLREVNESVNLISRKDMEDVEYRHVAFCAAIGAFFKPDRGAKIADVGTGGGLPGIVEAILWPQAQIYMFDGVGKKIRAIEGMVKTLGLKNARAYAKRIEEQPEVFDYATGRAVCALPMFFNFVNRKLRIGRRGSLENGVIYFKGGALEEEFAAKKIEPDAALDLEKFFGDERFAEKRLLHFNKDAVALMCK